MTERFHQPDIRAELQDRLTKVRAVAAAWWASENGWDKQFKLLELDAEEQRILAQIEQMKEAA